MSISIAPTAAALLAEIITSLKSLDPETVTMDQLVEVLNAAMALVTQ